MITIQEAVTIQAPIERCFDLARSVEVHLAGNVHFGETAVAIDGVTSGLLDRGDSVTWRARHFVFRWNLTSQITAFDRPAYFRDEQTRGPFRFMRHDHFFRGISPETTEMRDVFSFAAPLPVLGLIAETAFLRRYMRSLLRERNSVIRQIAESDDWRRYL